MNRKLKTFIPWMGGKSRLAKRIVSILPEHTCYCEVFAGGASVLWAKPRSKCEVINDLNSDLVNLYKIVKYHERALIAEMRWQLCSREGFGFSLKYSDRDLTDIQRAARYLTVVKCCFGGRGGCKGLTYGTATESIARFNRSIYSTIRLVHKRLNGVNVENDSFAAIIKRYDRPHTLFFCDPPYLDTAKYKFEFGLQQQTELKDSLSCIKGKFILTINDHPKIKELYNDYYVTKSKTQYSLQNAKPKNVEELIITNFKIK